MRIFLISFVGILNFFVIIMVYLPITLKYLWNTSLPLYLQRSNYDIAYLNTFPDTLQDRKEKESIINNERFSYLVFGNLFDNNRDTERDKEIGESADNCICMCGSYYGQDSNSISSSESAESSGYEIAKTLLYEYVSFKKENLDKWESLSDTMLHKWLTTYPSHSCFLLDLNIDYLWLISDAAASFPLWYSLSDSSIVVTTDVIAAVNIGYSIKSLTSIGAGHLVSIKGLHTLDSTVISYISHYQTDKIQERSRWSPLTKLDFYSSVILSSAMKSVVDTTVSIFNNVNRLDSSSLLLNCALELLNVNTTTKQIIENSKPFVKKPYINDSRYSLFFDIIDPVVISDSSLRYSFLDSWDMCLQSVDAGRIVSYQSGLVYNPMKTYALNLCASLMKVFIYYPFSSESFQNNLWRAEDPNSFLHQSVGILEKTGLCTNDKNLKVEDNNSPYKKSFANLWKIANRYATRDGVIVLLLATSGYIDLLTNFLCSTNNSSVDFNNFLIVTSDLEVCTIATVMNVGCYILEKNMLVWNQDENNSTSTNNFANFGSLSYQQLILFRTNITMQLLLMGFKPIIADIDTVWLSNPLEYLKQPFDLKQRKEGMDYYDLAVTDDNGEVCGCFVALYDSQASLLFWKELFTRHTELLKIALEIGKLENFSDSEQKLLTNMIYKGSYSKESDIRILPASSFPSGLAYFNQHKYFSGNNTTPVIVHNNFLIGKEMKKARFQLYNLWLADESLHGSEAICITNVLNILNDWYPLFDNVKKDINIPSLNVILPIHNSLVTNNRMIVQVLREEKNYISNKDLIVWVESDPPSNIPFPSSAIFELSIGAENIISSITANIANTNIFISVDTAVNRTIFSADFGGRHIVKANDNILKIKRNFQADANNVDVSYNFDTNSSTNESKSQLSRISYNIKVLCYTRSKSLDRLLKSLSNADYGYKRNISLEILIDSNKNPDDFLKIQEVVKVAESFIWLFGNKKITKRKSNIGLAAQWYYSWSPTSDEDVAFIFEDDVEVSPLYFKWTSRAVEKYYHSSSNQKQLHKKLLESVRAHIAINGSREHLTDFNVESDIDNFVFETAGTPLMYGICLQKQHLDPSHYPKPLNIRNGYKPFLYSLIGSWGPLMFPMVWQAFREWWRWKLNFPKPYNLRQPLTENLVVNYFYQNNLKIWTPWIVRFAYETGAKCLYSNIPDKYALAINHREAGENYKTTLGSDFKLLNNEIIYGSIKNNKSDCHLDWRNGNCRMSELQWSIFYLPEFDVLAQWQYDFHLKRLGTFGLDTPYHDDNVNHENYNNNYVCDNHLLEHYNNTANETLIHKTSLNNAIVWSNSYNNKLDLKISIIHLDHIIEMIESYLLPNSNILHVEISPLLPLISNKYIKHNIASTNQLFCNKINHKENLGNENLDSNKKLVTSCYLIENIPFINDEHNLAIINLSVISSVGKLTIIKKFLSKQRDIEFILVLDVCSSAPTDFSMLLLSENGFESHRNYTFVESICNLDSKDSGAVLYRHLDYRSESAMTSFYNRFAVSRQLSHSLVSRIMIEKIVTKL